MLKKAVAVLLAGSLATAAEASSLSSRSGEAVRPSFTETQLSGAERLQAALDLFAADEVQGLDSSRSLERVGLALDQLRERGVELKIDPRTGEGRDLRAFLVKHITGPRLADRSSNNAAIAVTICVGIVIAGLLGCQPPSSQSSNEARLGFLLLNILSAAGR